jgi:hypothetical protein
LGASLGSFLKLEKNRKFLGQFLTKCKICIIFGKTLGYVLGDFFTNASGHPVSDLQGQIFSREKKSKLADHHFFLFDEKKRELWSTPGLPDFSWYNVPNTIPK